MKLAEVQSKIKIAYHVLLLHLRDFKIGELQRAFPYMKRMWSGLKREEYFKLKRHSDI